MKFSKIPPTISHQYKRKQLLQSRKMRNKMILPLFIFLIAATGTIFDRSIARVEGFAPFSRTQRLVPPSSSLLISSHPPSYLRVQDTKSEDYKNVVEENRIRKFRRIFKKGTTQYTTQLIHFWLKSRRSVLTMCTVILFWFGAAGTHTPVSHGSSSSVTTGVVSRSNIFSSSLDKIVGKYVKSHMFDDDAYDPVESIYKEAMDDRLKGSYPKDLKETTSSVLGQNAIKADKKSSGAGFSGGLMKTVGFFRKQGLSEMQSIALLTSFFVIGVPTVFFGAMMQIATQNKRSMNRLMKNRYGETYTVDASEKIEDDVDVPDDDDDDDDDDE
jgi:hypothetical protein